MSKHYLVMSQSAFNGQVIDVAKLIAELGEDDLEAAERFALVDWAQMRVDFAVEALKAAATKHNAKFTEVYENSGYGESVSSKPPDGSRSIGVITAGGMVSLGVCVSRSGALSYYHNYYSSTHQSTLLDAWKKTIEQEFLQSSVEFAATLAMGVRPTKVEDEEVTTYVAILPQKEGE